MWEFFAWVVQFLEKSRVLVLVVQINIPYKGNIETEAV
jgi:hypothetical protein